MNRSDCLQKVTIREAAHLMGKSEQFIRVGLRNKRFPFGSAVKLSSQWTYYISPTLFYEYVGDKEHRAKRKFYEKKIIII